jgi:hypothetical protein
MVFIAHIDRSNREKIPVYFEAIKDTQGILTIPKMSGMFIRAK